jgi:hypothetical protein
MKRRIRAILFFLLLGFATTVAVAFILAAVVDVQQGVQSQADAYESEDLHWSVTRLDKAGAAQIAIVWEEGPVVSWSPQQAAGAPNTPQMGDQHTAWASLGTSSPEWLVLDYKDAVVPTRVDVYENHSPGAINKVTVFDEAGNESTAWSGVDPTPTTIISGPTPVSRIPLSSRIKTRRIKLYIASDKVPGWNEIDAVGLVDGSGQAQWARRVTASSTYASQYSTVPLTGHGNPADLVPYWSGLKTHPSAAREGQTSRAEWRVDARGWPLLALYSVADVSAGAASAGNPISTYSIEDESLSTAFTPPPGSGSTGPVAIRSGNGSTVALTTPSGKDRVPVPLHPIWVGLAGDTLIYALAWYALWAVLVIPRRFFREVGRMRRGGCVQCGYDLGFDFIHGCPECGWRRDHGSTAMTSRAGVSERVNGN